MRAPGGDPTTAASTVLSELADHALTLSHNRHISADKAKSLGLTIEMLEDDDELQERVLTVHHSLVQTLAETPAVKVIENHLGVAFISAVNVRAG